MSPGVHRLFSWLLVRLAGILTFLARLLISGHGPDTHASDLTQQPQRAEATVLSQMLPGYKYRP
jgi:uncharacterized membrane protein YedE/YeeE